MIHLVVIVAFAMLCAVWAVLQLSSGRELDGHCGACGLRDKESMCDGSSCRTGRTER